METGGDVEKCERSMETGGDVESVSVAWTQHRKHRKSSHLGLYTINCHFLISNQKTGRKT